MYSSPDDYRYNFTYLAKIRTTFAILLVFVLLSSLYSIAFVTTGIGNAKINTAFAKKRSSSKDGSNGGSSDTSPSSSSNNGQGTSGGSGTTDNTDNNPSPPPPPAATDNTGTGGQTGTTGQEQEQQPQQQEQQQQQCPTGQHFDINVNDCVDNIPPTPSPTPTPTPTQQPSQGLVGPSGGSPKFSISNDEICRNGIDDNGNGRVDEDPYCTEVPGKSAPPPPPTDGTLKPIPAQGPSPFGSGVPITKNSPEAAVLPQTPSAAKAAEAAAAAAAGAISIPPDGKCPPGYHLQDNWCYPDPITKNSPEAAVLPQTTPPSPSPAAKAAEAAAAAAAGAISVPPDGKCPPGYHLQGNWCYPDPITKNSPEAAIRQGIGGSTDTETAPDSTPQTEVRQPNANGGCPPGFHLLPPGFVCVKDVSSTPITKNSPEAATRQGIGGSTNTLVPTEGANPSNQFGTGNVGSLPPSALETTAKCPAGSHPDAPRGTCFPNSQPLSTGSCIPGWHLVADTHCEKDFAKIDTIPPNTTGDLPLEVGPSKFGHDTQNSIPPASTNPPVTPPANPASQPECVPGYHWDSSQQQCVADSTGNSNKNPDRFSPDAIGPNTFGQNSIPPNSVGPK